jgi:pantoate--beta-alanine ligase
VDPVAERARLPTVVVGPGRVGRTMAAVLGAADPDVLLLGRGDDAAPAVARAGTVLLTVGDDALPGVVAALAAAGAFVAGQLVVHTSGALGAAVLSPAADAGARTAAVHPVLPFTGDPAVDRASLAVAAVGLTTAAADPVAGPAARALVAAWGGDPARVVDVAETDRPAWHAAACVAANHAFAVITDGMQRLERLGVTDPRAVLAPVVEAAVRLALSVGPAAHTGPTARGDAGTVAGHLAVPAPRASTDAYRAVASLLSGQMAGLAGQVAGRGSGGVDGRGLRIARTVADLDAALAVTPRPRALVMTMGALHDGHLAHVARARDLVGPAGTVVLSIFVNPLQFGPTEDLATYPRTLDADLAAAGAAGFDVAFVPDAAAVYPNGEPTVRIDPGPLGAQLEGAARPGHFAGVLTVVSRILRLVAPDVATFGEKDYQQLTLVRAMVADLGPAVDIESIPVVREADGLAMSSRNARLSAADRARAAAIAVALRAGADAGADGPSAVLSAARRVLAASGIAADSLAVRAPDLGPAPASGSARLLLAAVVGGVRLLDNTAVVLGDPAAGPARQETAGQETR